MFPKEKETTLFFPSWSGSLVVGLLLVMGIAMKTILAECCRFEFGFYDGKNLASTQDVVIVTMNYRLNAFGFMALNELLEESVSLSCEMRL